MNTKIIPLHPQPEAKKIKWKKDETYGFLWLHVPTGIYYVRGFKKGRTTLFRSTGQRVKGKAKNRGLEIISKWSGGVEVYKKTFSDAANWVLKNHTPTQRPRTQDLHKNYIPQIEGIVGDMYLDRIGPDTLFEVIDKVKSIQRLSKTGVKYAKRKTFSDYSKAMNLVMRFAYDNRWTSHLIKFKNPDRPKETGRLLSRQEVTALWEAMNDDTRDQFVLALECFMRLREAICGEWSELNLESGEWTLSSDRVKTGSKTGTGRSFIVSPNALARMRARRQRMGDHARWIFPSPVNRDKPIWSTKTAWRNAKLKAGIKGSCRWHDLRHTGLTWVILGDPDQTPQQNKAMTREPIQVSAYAGVSLKTIQKVYLKKRASQTVSVAGAINILNQSCEKVVESGCVKGSGV